MPRVKRAGLIRTPASPTWTSIASTPRFSYNPWLADYCKPYPERLFGVAMLPMQSVELAIDEMRYAREMLGMRGGFLRPKIHMFAHVSIGVRDVDTSRAFYDAALAPLGYTSRSHSVPMRCGRLRVNPTVGTRSTGTALRVRSQPQIVRTPP
jgi:hypothetical protein